MELCVKIIVMAFCLFSLIVCQAKERKPEDYIRICMRNCGQCKEMYGRYFHGERCAESCITSKGIVLPDCNDPPSLVRYLKRADPEKIAEPSSVLELDDIVDENIVLRPVFWSYFWKQSLAKSI